MKRRSLFSTLLLISAVAAPAAFADTVTFTLLNPVQSGVEGSVLTYQGTASAPVTNTSIEYLNGVSETTSSGPLTVDVSDFSNEFPLFLNPGQSFTGDVFTITADAGSAGTATLGTIVLQGGSGTDVYDQLGSADFSAQVTTAATPEPSSLLLLATGITGGVGFLRRRQSQAASC